MNCTHPRQKITLEASCCLSCGAYKIKGKKQWHKAEVLTQELRRRGLTDWERLKLSFYRSDKKWRDHIQSREMRNINGRQVPFANGMPIPQQPRELLPPPKIQYIQKAR